MGIEKSLGLAGLAPWATHQLLGFILVVLVPPKGPSKAPAWLSNFDIKNFTFQLCQ